MIIGKSGSGKSASMRNLVSEDTAVFNVLGKPFPFRQKLTNVGVTDDYGKLTTWIMKTPQQIVVVDDAGYLITNQFMRGHAGAGKGNAIFSFYNEMSDNFWNLITAIRGMPGDKRVYVIMHEDESEGGNIKPKTIGKMLDEKVCLEGLFTICLRCVIENGKHMFLTESDGLDVSKSPMGMFATKEIDNDIALVDKTICEYYEIGTEKEQTA